MAQIDAMNIQNLRIRLPASIYQALEAYRARNGLRSLNAAIIHLIDQASRR